MTSKNTLSAKNLEALGAERLAELLIEISTGDAAAKRRLRLALAGAQSPSEVAKEVRKRLITIARSRSFVDWQNRRTLIEDLETQRRAIVDQVAKADPAEALELIWRFMALANPVFGRCDDSSGTVIGIFHAACRDLGEIAQAAKLAPEVLAERAFSALNENDYGQYDDLIGTLSPALGLTGLEQLKERFLELSKAPLEKPKDKDRRVIGWGVGGALYADEISSRQRETTIRLALQEIAEHPRDMHGKWTSGDQTESPAFKSWFGESKIVDEHGKPLVVYHGTRHEFSRFNIDKGQVGVHFSVSPEVANAFARSQGGEGGSVIPALIVRYTATLRVICVQQTVFQYTFLIFARRMMIQNPTTT